MAAYIVGSIPTAYLLSRATRGIDIRAVGTRNVGTANVWREVGRKQGLIVLVLDAGKGALAAGVARLLGLPDWALFVASVAALTGHNFSPFLRFYGGKGVAVVIGVCLVVMPAVTAATALPAGLIALALTRNVVLVFAAGVGALFAGMGFSREPAFNFALVGTMVVTVLATAYGRDRSGWHRTAAVIVRRHSRKS